jgi:hypothetical protein
MRWCLLAGAAAIFIVLVGQPARAEQAFFTEAFTAAVPIPNDPDRAEVLFLKLPRGKYLVSAVANLAASGSPVRLVDCFLTVDGVIFSQSRSTGTIGGQPNNFLSLPLVTGVKLENREQTLAIECRTGFGDVGVVSQPSSLAAPQVRRLEIQVPE